MKFNFFPLHLSLARPYRWAKGSHKVKYGMLVSIEDRTEKAIGWGEVALQPHERPNLSSMMRQLTDLVEGLDPSCPSFIAKLDSRNPYSRLRNGIVSAVMTARAWQNKLPLFRYLRSDSETSPIYLNGYVDAVAPEEAVQRATSLYEAGIRTVKVKCTADYKSDLKRVSAMAQQHQELVFRLDPNGAWEHVDPIKAFKAFSKLPIEYVEEPIPFDPVSPVLRELSKIIPLAADHWGSSLDDLKRVAEGGYIHNIILKSQIFGGPDRTLAIAQHANALGLKSVMTASLETLVGITVAQHCAAAMPSRHIKHGLCIWDFISPNVTKFPEIKNGQLELPCTPGLGFEPTLQIREGIASPGHIEQC